MASSKNLKLNLTRNAEPSAPLRPNLFIREDQRNEETKEIIKEEISKTTDIMTVRVQSEWTLVPFFSVSMTTSYFCKPY